MFKKGDRVRVIKLTEHNRLGLGLVAEHTKIPIGFETVVVIGEKDKYLSVKGKDKHTTAPMHSCRFEKIEEEEMFQPKSGMIAKIEDNCYSKPYYGLYIEVNDKLHILCASNKDNKFTTYVNNTPFWESVVEIYEGMNQPGTKGLGAGLAQNLGHKVYLGKLLWSKELPKVEIYIAEIAEKFNIKPEQVKIKEEQ